MQQSTSRSRSLNDMVQKSPVGFDHHLTLRNPIKEHKSRLRKLHVLIKRYWVLPLNGSHPLLIIQT